MKRLCVMGDSHTAALKAGWSDIADDHPDLDVVFFGAGGSRLGDLTVEDGALVTSDKPLMKLLRYTSGGKDRIDGAYDGYILCGLALSLTNLTPIVKCFRSEGESKDMRMALSDACYRACFVGTCRVSLMGQTLAKLRQISAAPAAVMVQPLPAPRPWLKNLALAGDDVIVARFMNAAMADMAQGFDARFVAQPQETLDDSALTTDAVFFQDAVHMFGKPDDRRHANARYGTIMLKAALAALETYP
jgi:hypothetical protein